MTDLSPTQELNREEPAVSSSQLRTRIQWIGLISGPILALVCYELLPTSYENGSGETVAFLAAGRATLAVMVWMATWWITEALDVSITALLPIGLFPILGITTIRTACAPYAHEMIFLFMGGFLLALSMQRWGLDRRIALITLKLVGTKPVNMVAGFMLATAGLSAFVSNTATTAMMLPIALSVTDLVLKDRTDGQGRNFALCLMLGVAYAASIGGVATIIGTPPNVFLIGFIKDQYDIEISFVQWLAIGLPLTIVFLPLTWLLLTRVLYPIRLREIEGGAQLIASQYARLGPVNRGQWITFIVFTLTALSWIFRPLLQKVSFSTVGGDVFPFDGLTDTGIVMIAAMLLFVIPVDIRQHTFTMNWETARKLPWGILILFGGGLSLAGAVRANGVAEFIGAQTVAFASMPNILIVLLVVTMMIFFTELTSNTATTATLIPILAGLAAALGLHPFMLIVPATIAASYAFMMPVATPPNAIVFGSGHVTIAQMCKAGLWLNIIGIALVTGLMYLIAKPLLHIP
ncbi:MAG: DASS family sodium-coupled anion symporter [Planctomycetes bacterium]|nr:DASS family sodium-coupled anion symporter [Planctomycetota bacterium]